MKNTRLFWQLLPANLLTVLAAMILLFWIGGSSIRQVLISSQQEDLEARARLIATDLARLTLTAPEHLQAHCRQLGRQAATRITVVAPDGMVLADSNEDPARMENHANRPELRAALAGAPGTAIRFSTTLGQKMHYVAIPLLADDTRQIGALRLSLPAKTLSTTLLEIRLQLLPFGLLLLGLSALLSLLVARRISRPLEEMRRGAERLARGETDSIVSAESMTVAEELNALGRALNRLGRQIRERLHTITSQRNELESVFASMAEMVLVTDSEKRVTRLNRSAAALFYLSPDDVQGKMLHGVIRNKDLHEIVDQVLATGKPAEKDIIVFVGADRVFLQTRAVPLIDEADHPTGVLVVLNDMTRLHKLEHLRRDFVANVSHELKTPVTSIQGYVETLLDGALDSPEDARRFLETIARQTTRLNAIIDDLLLLSRIELKTDHQEITLTRAPVAEILAAAVQTCAVRAAGKMIQVTVLCTPDLSATLNPNLIEQAVINLLSNAITYSPENTTVTVSAERQPRGERERLVISVADQGIGIERDLLERLFERFYRTDEARSRANGGTGLGLSIVKHIAIAHKGSVTVQSEPGHGSTFSLILPQ